RETDAHKRDHRQRVIRQCSAILSRNDTERNRNAHRDEHCGYRKFDRGRISLSDQFEDRTFCAERGSEVAVKDRAPIVGVTIIESVPAKVPMTVFIGRQPEEEWWPIEAVLRTELCELFGRGLVPQHSHCGIAGNKLDQQGDQRDNGPNHEHEKAQATEHSEDFALHQDVVEFPTADDSRMSLRAAIAEPYGEWGKTNVARRELASSATRPRQPYYRLASPTDYVVLVDCPGGPNQVVGAN